jgi:hypothetical protein
MDISGDSLEDMVSMAFWKRQHGRLHSWGWPLDMFQWKRVTFDGEAAR